MLIIGIGLLYDGISDLVLMIVAAYAQHQSDKRIREFAANAESGIQNKVVHVMKMRYNRIKQR